MNPTTSQIDFNAYYFAGRALNQGHNPYDHDRLKSTASPGLTVLPFVYTPFSFPFVKLLAQFDRTTAYYLFLALKLISAAALIYIWRTFFLFDKGSPVLFLAFATAGFNGALMSEISTGNITVMTEILLWSGLVFFIQGRMFLFSLFIMAASLFKLFYLPLLVLGLFSRDRLKFSAFAALLLAAAGLALLLFYREHLAGFLAGLTLLPQEGGVHAPGLMAFGNDLFKLIGAERYAVYSYFFYLVAIGLISTVTLKRLISLKFKMASPELAFLLCSLLILCLPRLKDYYLISLIAPAYYVIMSKIRHLPVQVLALVLFITPGCLPTHWSLSSYNLIHFILNYYPLYLALATWLLCLPATRPMGAVDSGAGQAERVVRPRMDRARMTSLGRRESGGVEDETW